jgi:predicted membrane GTPase involved in stress response
MALLHQQPLVDADELVRLVPPRKLSLGQALAFLREDECIEVTPDVGGCARSRSASSAA